MDPQEYYKLKCWLQERKEKEKENEGSIQEEQTLMFEDEDSQLAPYSKTQQNLNIWSINSTHEVILASLETSPKKGKGREPQIHFKREDIGKHGNIFNSCWNLRNFPNEQQFYSRTASPGAYRDYNF